MDGRLRATIESSELLWQGAWDKSLSWVSLVGMEERLVLIADLQPYLINPEREDPISFPLAAPVSGMRLWETAGHPMLGICLPQLHMVAVGRSGIFRPSGHLIWPFSTLPSGVTVLGSDAGQGAGDFLFPLSFDVGPDGQVFVLDAGNARIQVFDQKGNYTTQWGRKGADQGEFDFGHGRMAEDFAGSVVVDNEGYIYVADVFNRRIQKFAP